MRWYAYVKMIEETNLNKRVFEARNGKNISQGKPRKSWQEGLGKMANRRGVKWEDVGM